MKLTPSSEDYLEAILMLSKDRRVVRVKDLASKMGVTMSSVVAALRSLADKGLVVHERYGYLELTEEGRNVAREVLKRHNLLFHFFHDILGVRRELSDRDACNVEHQLSRETLEALVVFLDVIKEEMNLKKIQERIEKALNKSIEKDGKE